MKRFLINRKGFHTLLTPFLEMMEKEVNLKSKWQPSIDIFEADDSFCMIIDLPGVRKEDIKLYIDGRKLIIDGQKREYIKDRFCNSIKYHRIERPIGNFHREVVLPSYVQLDNMKIEYNDGVLHIILKKPKKTVIRVE